MAQMVKNPPAMRETWVPSLGREDALEKGTGQNIIYIYASPASWETCMQVRKQQLDLDMEQQAFSK